jgi:uncharacterized membrane protein YphA (DoxX/SURF4 family)
VEGWFFATAALLVVSGVNKLVDAAPTTGALRSAGLPSGREAVWALASLEVVVGAANLISASRFFALAQSALFVAFGSFVAFALWRRIPIASCGCFGRSDTPPTFLHLLVNMAASAGAIVVALSGPRSLWELISGQPMVGLPYLGFVVFATYALYLVLTLLPQVWIRH